ncbi:hypothetical protein GJ688_05950 [Heliobacillus mobilis]|uniref:Uncharacterized protein n=1 Tax=Heliobacterium mobile TaxID=28064 RepID=A0A6I3SI27_HELMO|nr:hypothetical protein [Heliobacterium mobile]MTV48524.1 hypothetical protein [Heliobacterium mobile]
MCVFITAVLPEEADMEMLRPLLDKYEMDFSTVENTYILNQLVKGDR